MKRFDLQRGGKVRFEKSQVEEFNVLNDELSKLTEKVTDDYRNLKEFTENMSHETQTPLAVIRSKLELLLQSDNLKPEQVEQVHATMDAVNRLSKMNRGLILLTRIDNDQYVDEQDIVFSGLIRKHLEDLDLFAQSRNIAVITSFDEKAAVRMNPYLADILVSNLLSNAIKY
ncbi:MAG: sensor histidine kinase, partial [Flavobacteriales bacterium]